MEIRRMLTGGFGKRSVKTTGGLALFVLTLVLALPTCAEEPLTNAGEALLSGMDLGSKREIIQKRTESSKTFANPDGSFTFVTGINPVHYKDAQGNWREIMHGHANHTPPADGRHCASEEMHQCIF
jgi:hypothetical protein